MGDGSDRAWRTITIEDSSPPVGFARLDADRASGAFAALVRFPAGWERPGTGRYVVEEELLVLEGELHMTGVVYRAGDYAHLPAGYVRSRSAAPRGALALAFFGGPADWIRLAESVSEQGASPPIVWREVTPRRSSIAGSARLLRETERVSTWLVDGPLAARAPRDARVQLFSLTSRSWAAVAPDGPIPPLPIPCLYRLVRSSDARGHGETSVDRDLSDI